MQSQLDALLSKNEASPAGDTSTPSWAPKSRSGLSNGISAKDGEPETPSSAASPATDLTPEERREEAKKRAVEARSRAKEEARKRAKEFLLRRKQANTP
jgi:hypothetical protein